MLIDQNPARPDVARKLAYLMAYLEDSVAESVVGAQLDIESGQSGTFKIVNQEGLMPKWAYYKAGGLWLIMIGGCSVLQMGHATVVGYRGDSGESVVQPTNQYFNDIMISIRDPLFALGIRDAEKVVVTGHSLGGAVAYLYAGELKRFSPMTTINCCTFGAPKPGGEAALANGSRAVVARWMADDDPVPLVPPTAADTLAAILVFSIRDMQRFQHFLQPAGGISITAAGAVESAVVPPRAALTAGMSLAAWLYAVYQDRSSPHSIVGYGKRLDAFFAANFKPVNAPVNKSGEGTVDATSKKQLTNQRLEQHAELTRLEATNRRLPLQIPENHRCTVQRLGNVFVVTQGGVTISVNTRKRGAFSLARKINEAYFGMLQQGLLSPDGVEKALHNFILGATTPGSGVSPQVQDNLRL